MEQRPMTADRPPVSGEPVVETFRETEDLDDDIESARRAALGVDHGPQPTEGARPPVSGEPHTPLAIIRDWDTGDHNAHNCPSAYEPCDGAHVIIEQIERASTGAKTVPALDAATLAVALNGDPEIAVPLGHDLLPLARRILARLAEQEGEER